MPWSIHAADYRKHTEIIASEPLSKNVKNKGKFKVFINNALINATESEMNFTNEDPDVTYSIAPRENDYLLIVHQEKTNFIQSEKST